MKKVIAVLACGVLFFGAACGSTKTASTSTQTSGASTAVVDGEVSTLGKVTYAIPAERWTKKSEDSNMVEYASTEDENVGLVVITTDLSGTAVVDKTALLETFVEQVEQSTGGSNIESENGEKDGVSYARMGFDYTGYNEAGDAVPMKGLAYVGLTDTTAAVLMLAGGEDISEYDSDFTSIINSMVLQ